MTGQPEPSGHGGQPDNPSLLRPGRILPLTEAAVARIHSSKHITSLKGVVCSLLENSLDSGANKVTITVDWKRGACSVEDNGAGIPAADFAPNGGLCKMHCTSKQTASSEENHPKHGSTGMFLAELSALALLSITSACRDGATSSALTLHHGEVIARQTAVDDASHFAALHRKFGTRVSVRDLFGNMPVRVKQRALSTTNGHDHDKLWQEVKHDVVALLLAWPRPCWIRLEDANTAVRRVSLSTGTAAGLTERSLGQMAGRSLSHDLRDALPVVFQASLAPSESRHEWVPLSASTVSVSLKGTICREPAPTKQCQFIAIDVNPCSRSDAHHDLYHAVNKLISNSQFGMVEHSPSRGHYAAGDGSNRRELRREIVNRGTDRHAMYLLQFKFRDRYQAENSAVESMHEVTLQCLLEVLEVAVHAWLERNRFRPWKRRRRDRGEHASGIRATDGTAPNRPSQSPRAQTAGGRSNTRPPSPVHGQLAEQFRRPAARAGPLTAPSNEQHGGEAMSGVDCDWRLVSRVRSGVSRALHTEQSRLETTHSRNRSHVSGIEDGSMVVPARGEERIQAPPLAIGQLNGANPSVAMQDHPPLSSDGFGSIDDEDILTAEQQVGEESFTSNYQDSIFTWTDAVSKQSFRVNSRTGVVLPCSDRPHTTQRPADSASNSRQRAAIDIFVTSAGNPISLSRRSVLASCRPATHPVIKESWLPGFLREWKNPVFARKDQVSIPTASLSGPGLVEQLEQDRRCCRDEKFTRAFATHGQQTGNGTILYKTALRHAKIIGQVDQKFILLKMQSRSEGAQDERTRNASSVLVLVDQHAASERIILEDLLTDMVVTPGDPRNGEGTTIIRSTSLQSNTTRAKHLIFEISDRENELFTQYHFHFQSWGITYTLSAGIRSDENLQHDGSSQLLNHKQPSSHRLTLTHLPTLIAERGSTSPGLIIDLLRSEIWSFLDGERKPVPPGRGRLPPPSCTSFEPHTSPPPLWLSLLPYIPAKMLSIIQSRACRSAVMFNDVLTTAECADLVQRLAACVFPFVCAHGRVGVVPVMDLGRADLEGGGCSDLGLSVGTRGKEVANEERWMQNREEGVDGERLRGFLRSVRGVRSVDCNGRDGSPQDEDEDADEDEEMLEASPHKFA